MKAYGLYDVQLVISTGVQLSDERDEREPLFLCLYTYACACVSMLGLDLLQRVRQLYMDIYVETNLCGS